MDISSGPEKLHLMRFNEIEIVLIFNILFAMMNYKLNVKILFLSYTASGNYLTKGHRIIYLVSAFQRDINL
jgi:hypothetical protein